MDALTTCKKQGFVGPVSRLPGYSSPPQAVSDAMPDHSNHLYPTVPSMFFGSTRDPQANSSTKHASIIKSTSLPLKTFINPQSTHSRVLTPPSPDRSAEITPLHKSPISTRFTETVICDQPVLRTINLVLRESEQNQTCPSPSTVVSGPESKHPLYFLDVYLTCHRCQICRPDSPLVRICPSIGHWIFSQH